MLGIFEGKGEPSDYEKYYEVEEEVHKCNCIKYAAYRTATKLRILQKALGFDFVYVGLVKNVLEHRRFLLTDCNILLTREEVEDILYDIFYAAVKHSSNNISVDKAVGFTVKFLSKVYGFENNAINILNFKVGVVALCSSPLQMKYSYWFSQLADHNLRLGRKRLQNLLESLLCITYYVSESNTFSTNLVQATIDSCFVKGNSYLGINESEFICWVVQEPQLLVWLSTLYRMRSSEKVNHNVQCASCSKSPIVGLRYHCLRCLGYDMCQMCFFTARRTKRHKPSHLIREYCSKTTSCETTVAYLKGIISRICGSATKLQYLPAHATQTNREPANDEDPLIAQGSDRSSGFSEGDSTTLMRPKTQLQTIISQIESEKSLLAKALDGGSAANIIQHHTQFLQDHLDRLRALKKEIDQEEPFCFRSTPCNNRRMNDFELSPIVVQPERNWELPSPSGFSTWLEKKSPKQSSTYTEQLQRDLDHIMEKLNGLLETTFTEEKGEDFSNISA